MASDGTTPFRQLQSFLDRLDASKTTYRLDRIRGDSVMVEVYLPRVHWEVEFFTDGTIEAEKYTAVEDLYGPEAIDLIESDLE